MIFSLLCLPLTEQQGAGEAVFLAPPAPGHSMRGGESRKKTSSHRQSLNSVFVVRAGAAGIPTKGGH